MTKRRLRVLAVTVVVALVGIVPVRQDPMGQRQRRRNAGTLLVRRRRQRPQVLLEAIGHAALRGDLDPRLVRESIAAAAQ